MATASAELARMKAKYLSNRHDPGLAGGRVEGAPVPRLRIPDQAASIRDYKARYSCRNASSGCTFAARRAGISEEITATAASIPVTAKNVPGSVGVNSKSNFVSS
jgi:hypothetical protein